MLFCVVAAITISARKVAILLAIGDREFTFVWQKHCKKQFMFRRVMQACII
jgi:hypothetical protein